MKNWGLVEKERFSGVAATSGGNTSSPFPMKRYDFKLFLVVIQIHAVRCQMTNFQSSEVAEKVDEGHVKLSVVLESQAQ